MKSKHLDDYGAQRERVTQKRISLGTDLTSGKRMIQMLGDDRVKKKNRKVPRKERDSRGLKMKHCTKENV